ncbi:uncharacterized protein [Phaseolus vulgaris]|uniref:uncharacterized protein n=1 Tax=Phaseolus vulgaris TaxID=3885 RepID=UPI0035C9E58C
MVEKARKEYLVQVQETIKMEILMGQTVGPLDCKVVELQAENSSLRERSQMVEELQAENASLRQQDSQRVEMLKSAKEATAAAERKLEEAVGKLSEAASSLAALTTQRDAAEASRRSLEAEKEDLMNVGADSLIDGFELALEQVRCVLPELDLSQFSIHHSVVDGKLRPPTP